MATILFHGEPFVTTQEAAELLGVSKSSLLRWAAAEKAMEIVITLPNGLRFIRCFRTPGDRRRIVFWAVQGVTLPKLVQGFAAMSEPERRAAQSKGGKHAHFIGRAHQFTPEEARQAGIKGGTSLAKDREHMRRIGQIGNKRSPGNRRK